MNAAYTLEELKRLVSPVCEKYNLAAAYIFGSYARGEMTPSSDVDVLIDTGGSRVKSLFDMGGVYSDFEDTFHKPIDLLSIDELYPSPRDDEWDISLRSNVMRERIKLYERK